MINIKNILFYTLILTISLPASSDTWKIYFDADMTNHIESAESIQQGVKVAFSEIDNQIQGLPVEFIALDHKGNTARSKRNMGKFKKDNSALVLFAGLHSPPLIKYRDYINQQQILTLVPWAAGAPITRYPSGDNWVYRLSVDDTKAGERIAQFANQKLQCKSPHLLLENTPWGKSNEKNMTRAWQGITNATPGVSWFSWGITESGARLTLQKIIQSKSDCIFLVSNALEGNTFISAMDSLPKEQQIKFVSHWGITGGNISPYLDHLKETDDLHFIQSCFSFISSTPTALSAQVLKEAQYLFPQKIKQASDILAPTGFIHGYDLAKVLISALKKVQLSDDINANRLAIKQALENLQTPITGLVKTYNKPFSNYDPSTPDAHEALNVNDLCMAKFLENGDIFVLAN